MRKILICIFCLLFSSIAFGQEYLIESPTTYIIPEDEVKFTFKVYPERGTMMGRIDIGTFEYFYLGLSYRVDSLIGYYDGAAPSNWLYWLVPDLALSRWLPGVHARFRLLNEPVSPVSVAAGFDLQARCTNVHWYIRPLYVVLGKTIGSMLSSYAGVGYMGPFAGAMFEIHPMTFFIDWSLIAAWWEEDREQILDIGLRWSPEPAIGIELDIKNTLGDWGGAFKVVYTMSREFL